jgi:hypothetical protein
MLGGLLQRSDLVELLEEHTYVETLKGVSLTCEIEGVSFTMKPAGSIPASRVSAETWALTAGNRTLLFRPFVVHVDARQTSLEEGKLLESVWQLSQLPATTQVQDCGWDVCGRIFPENPLLRLRLMAFVRATCWRTWYRMVEPPSVDSVVRAFARTEEVDYAKQDRRERITTLVGVAG